MSLIRPIEDWPLILCGPMLRRVTATQVAVFVALREPALVRLRLYGSSNSELIGAAADKQPTRALGERLHVVVAQSTYELAQLPGGSGLYDLEITWLRDDVLHTATLQTLGKAELANDNPDLLSGEHALGYAEGALPGFRIADSLESLALVHASCRKPHGEGPDMLALVDQLMVERANGSTRPHQLILTGDQIYADDVAVPLARLIAATAPELMTSSPALRVPGAGYHGEFPDAEAQAGDDPPGRAMNHHGLQPGPLRRHHCREVAGLSSTECEGHLMYLGEFYAMYLLAWSPALWPDAPDHGSNELLKARLERFVAGLPKVRRALANISSFMIFDDHEVSDDWNLSRHTVDRIFQGWSGRQVIRNALCAYAVFQDWGNRPAHYQPEEPGATLLDALTCPQTAGEPLARPASLPPVLAREGQTQRNTVNDLFGLRRHMVPELFPTMDWHYHVALPSHLLIALDTRTRRLLPADGGPAGIIDPAHLGAQLDQPRLAHPDLNAIVIAPGPLFDLPPTEWLKDGVSQAIRIGIGSRPSERYAGLDRETWSGHRAAMQAMVEQLMSFRWVLLLSGDLHYGFTHDVAVADAFDRRARIVQLCASAACNEGFATRVAIVATVAPTALGSALPEPPKPVWWLLDHAPHFRAQVLDSLQEAADITRALGVVAEQTTGELQMNLLRLDLGSAVDAVTTLPLDAMREMAGFEPLAGLAVPTDMLRCRVRHVLAEIRDGVDGLRPCTGSWVQVPPASTGNDPAALASAEQALLKTQYLRQAVGLNNIGLLQFLPDEITHTLYWYTRNTAGHLLRLWCTEHRVSRVMPSADEV